MSVLTKLFADGLLEAAVHNGVARLTLGQIGVDGKPVPSGQLILPLSQLPTVVNGLVTLLRQVEQKAREAQPAAAEPAPEPVEATMPGTFTFGAR